MGVALIIGSPHSWVNSGQIAKITFEKFVKLTGHTYAYNSLTNFQYEVHAMTGNGNQVNLLKVFLKNS
jgi:hypothetical protein